MVRWISQGGFGWLINWLMIPFICLPYLALMIGGAPMLLLPEELGRLRTWLILSGTIVVYAFLIWRMYCVPHGDYLVLHQFGFRIRIGLKTASVLFDDLQGIVIGRTPIRVNTRGLKPGIFVSVLPHPGLLVVEPPVPDELVAAIGATLEIHLTDGTKRRFKGVLTRFEVASLQAFFEFIHRHHPRLLLPTVPK